MLARMGVGRQSAGAKRLALTQVSDVAVLADNGRKLPPAELVLVDGRREPLPMLSRPQSVNLREHALRQTEGRGDGRWQE